MSGARLHTLLPELTTRQSVMVVGAAVIDVIADAYALPWRGCDIELKQQSVNVGGCALNIAVALKRLGIEAGNALPLGQGVWAEMIRNRMNRRKSTGKMDIKVMLGLDALILLRDKNFLVFFFCSFLFAMPLAFYYIFANGYLTEVGMKNATGWMTLGQFSEIFFMLALPFFTKRFGIKKVLLLGLVTAAIRYGFFIYGSADEYFTYALLFLGILLHGVSYDFYYVTAYIYVDKKAPVHMRTAAQGLITLCCQGFGSLLGYRLGGVMMEKMFAYQEPVNGLTFNWSGMWTFGAVMIAIIAVLFMIFFRESDNEITAIKVDDRDIALTQGEVK